LLPLLLWKAPPGLEMILAQEGIAFERVREGTRPGFDRGRFVLYDGRRASRGGLRAGLGPWHVALDIDSLRGTGRGDPFAELIDTRAMRANWDLAGTRVTERVSRVDRARLRATLLGRLSAAVQRVGGVWARLGPYPHPYRSAFNFRVDLDEPMPDDYASFARAREPLEDCTTHFVSTAAYGTDRRVLADLRGRDAQSHGHFHVVYRSASANRQNLRRADALLRAAGIEPSGFAAPEGRWNVGLDEAIAAHGYGFSSDFQLGRDDVPFFPWLGDRCSPVLQVPIHPLCEGLFFEAGATDSRAIAGHYVRTVRAKIAAGEPAFVYGHPERRLARVPEVLARLAESIRDVDLLWRVTLTEFARWWRWRSGRRWSLVERSSGHYEALFEDGDSTFTPSLEILRGDFVARVPVRASRVPLDLAGVAYERRRPRADLGRAVPQRGPWGLRVALRRALDWETVTPLAELPADTPRAAMKKALRSWRESGPG
jgi:hypothetical protein